jgi:hypothetical protein
LTVAVIVVSIIEWLRELIRGSEQADHRRTLGSILISILLLGIFELCVLAYEEVSRTGLENSGTLTEVAEKVTSSGMNRYGFVSSLSTDQANEIIFELFEANKNPARSPKRRILELLPDLQKALAYAPPEPPLDQRREGGSEALQEFVNPIWRAWLPWAAPLAAATFPSLKGPTPPSFSASNSKSGAGGILIIVEGSEDSIRIQSLTLALNKILANVDFYRRDYFDEPVFQSDGLKGIGEELALQQQLRSELRDTDQQLVNHTGGDDSFELQRDNRLARLLPLQDIVMRNVQLLGAIFHDVFEYGMTSPSVSVPGVTELGTLATIWILAGAVLGWTLGFSVLSASDDHTRSALREARRGAIAALVAAPSAVVFYLLLMRFGMRAEAISDDLYYWGYSWGYVRVPSFLQGHSLATRFYILIAGFQTHALIWLLSTHAAPWIVISSMILLLFLWRQGGLTRSSLWLLVYLSSCLVFNSTYNSKDFASLIGVPAFWGGTLLLVACMVLAERRFGFLFPLDLIGWGLFAICLLPKAVSWANVAVIPLTFVPLLSTVALSFRKIIGIRRIIVAIWLINATFFLFADLDVSLFRLFILVAMVWLIPGMFIGASVPYLKRGSSIPKAWGIVAILIGTSLIVVTWLRLENQWWIIIPGGLLILTGILVQRGWRVEEFWPLAGLALGLLISGGTYLFQQASFSGVLAGFYAAEPGAATLEQELGVTMDGRPYVWVRNPTRPDRIQLLAFTRDLEKTVAEENSRLAPREKIQTEILKLSIVGSLGFWMTIGLLAGWSILSGSSGRESESRVTKALRALPTSSLS